MKTYTGVCAACRLPFGECRCNWEVPDVAIISGEPTEASEIVDLIGAIRNRCDIFMKICYLPETSHLWPTVLEDMYEDAQKIAMEYCAHRDG